jgi:hypothetical protein
MQCITKDTQVLVIAYCMVVWDVAPKQFAGHSRTRQVNRRAIFVAVA